MTKIMEHLEVVLVLVHYYMHLVEGLVVKVGLIIIVTVMVEYHAIIIRYQYQQVAEVV